MEEFLKEYVRMYAEAKGVELTRKQIKEAVINLECNEDLWDVFDNYIDQEIEDVI